MNDVINRNDAIEAINGLLDISGLRRDFISRRAANIALKRIPPAGRGQGQWITKIRHEHYPSGKEYEADYCSVCGKRGELDYSFCPHCGADMKGEQDAVL